MNRSKISRTFQAEQRRRAPADADRQNAQKNGIDDIGAHQLDGGQIAAEVEVQKGKPADQRENSQAEQIPVEVSGVVTALHGGKEHGGAGDFSDGMQENRQQGAVGDKGEGDMVDHHGRHRHGLQMIEGEPAPGPLQAFSGRGRAGGQPLWRFSGKAAAFLQTVVGHATPSMAAGPSPEPVPRQGENVRRGARFLTAGAVTVQAEHHGELHQDAAVGQLQEDWIQSPDAVAAGGTAHQGGEACLLQNTAKDSLAE